LGAILNEISIVKNNFVSNRIISRWKLIRFLRINAMCNLCFTWEFPDFIAHSPMQLRIYDIMVTRVAL